MSGAPRAVKIALVATDMAASLGNLDAYLPNGLVAGQEPGSAPAQGEVEMNELRPHQQAEAPALCSGLA
jgi:hypothetical protein